MATVTALPTMYRGTRYRSRLEARVAAAFDAAPIPYQYEPEGLQIGDVYYLPDFRLTAANVWVEVKPTWEAVKAETKAQALAAARQPTVYLFPRRDHLLSDRDYLVMMAAGGQPSRFTSVAWTRCPSCNVITPWCIGAGAAPCCLSGADPDVWWDGNRSLACSGPFIHFGVLSLPQYQDGKMLWSR